MSLWLPPSHLSHLGTGVATCSHLRRLSLEGCLFKDEGLRLLQPGLLGNGSLEELSVAGCGITAEGARLLASIVKQRVTQCAFPELSVC